MKRFAMASAAVIGLAYPLAVRAQDSDNRPAPEAENATADGEIIVTAQRRDQRLQDVPLAVTAIGGEDLEKGRINSITDLQTSTPGLTAFPANRPGTSTSITLRGVGTSGNDSGLESAVGFSIDGVPRSRSGTGLGDFVDIESVEVLRGPQGTLFGKNTTAGVIQVTRRRPDLQNFDGFLEGTYGNYNLAHIRAAANLPFIPGKAALRVSFGYNKRDGFIKDPLKETSYNDRDRFNLTAKLRVELSPAVEIMLSGDYSETDEICCQPVRFTNGRAAGGGNAAYVNLLSSLALAHGNTYPVIPNPTDYKKSANGHIISANKDRGIQIDIKADIGNLTLNSVSSYRNFDDLSDNDVDYTGADLLYQRVPFNLKVLTQELRLQGSAFEGHLDWLVGGFFASEKIHVMDSISTGIDLNPYFTSLSPQLSGLFPQLTNSFGNKASQDSKSYAIFTHNIVNITDSLRFTAGLRWTKENKHAVSTTFYNGPNAATPFRSAISPVGFRSNSYDRRLNDDAFSGTAALDYKWTPDIMTYVSYSRGYKAGAIGLFRDAGGPEYSRNALCAPPGATPVSTVPVNVYRCTPVDPRVEPETVNSIEAGIRTQFFDRRLTLNLSVFDSKYQNLQLNTFNGTSFVLSNAGTARSRGIEIETAVRIIDGVRLSGNLNYLNAKYGNDVPSVSAGEPPLSNTDLNYASKWSGAVNLDVNKPLSSSTSVFFRPEMYWRSSFLSPTRTSSSGTIHRSPGFTLFNLAGGFRLDDKWEISVFCRNCTDKRYVHAFVSAVAQSGSREAFVGNPAEYGISLRFDW